MDKKSIFSLSVALALTASAATATTLGGNTPKDPSRDAIQLSRLAQSEAVSPAGAIAIDHAATPLQAAAVSGSSELQQASLQFQASRGATRSVSLSDLDGQRILMAHRSTGYLLTDTATVTTASDGTVTIAGFVYSDLTVTATVDITTGELSIPVQKVYTLDEGDIYICRLDQTLSAYSTTSAIEGVVEDGNIHISDPFGFFVIEGDYAGSYLTAGLMNYADAVTPNASITNNVISFSGSSLTTDARSVTASTTWAHVYQLSDEYIRISHIAAGSGYVDMLAILNSDGTISIDPQPLYYVSYYGYFCCYALTETVSGTSITLSATILSPIEATYDTSTKTISIGKWMTANTSGNVYQTLVESTSVTSSAELSFPAAATLSLAGEGTQDSPYLVTSAADIASIANYYTNSSVLSSSSTDAAGNTYYPSFKGIYFKMTADIDFADFKNVVKPIGSTTYQFAGTFDGAGYTISNYTITDYAYDYLGLFGCISIDGTVKNVKFQDPYLTSLGYSVAAVAGRSYGTVDSCDVSGGAFYATVGYYAGGIVAQNYGTVSNCSFADNGYIKALGYIGGISGRSYGTLSGCSVEATLAMTGTEMFVGGIVGYQTTSSAVSVTSIISDCDFTGTITASSDETSTGGIAGMIATSSIERCYANAWLYSAYSSYVYLGGLVGALWQSSITDSYATGIIEGRNTDVCGGLVARNDELSSSSGSSIKNSYASTIILTTNSGTTYGIIGSDQYDHTTIENCYYDSQLNPVDNDTWALTTAQLTAGDTLAGLSSTVWKYEAGLYPRLADKADRTSAQVSAAPIFFQNGENWQMVKSDFSYSTANDVVWKGVVNNQLSTEGGYAYTFNNGTATLNYMQYTDTIYVTKDGLSRIFYANIAPIELSGEGTEESPWLITSKADLLTVSDVTNNASFSFDGYYFKVTADIDFEGDTIVPICKDTSASFSFLGTLDGDGHTIDNMVVTTAGFYEEGNSSGVEAGVFNPKSSDSYYYGGLFANIGASGTVKNLNIGSGCVIDCFMYGGAIAGSNAGLIENCSNYAPVTTYYSHAGGIVGTLLSGGTVRGCYNAGYVRSDYGMAGGIAGGATSATIENCANAGEVGAVYFNAYRTEGSQKEAGGIVGEMTSSTVRNVVNSGNVTSYQQVGGIAGYAKGTTSAPASITGAVNYGLINSMTDASTAGHIIGNNSLATADSVYYSKSILKIGAVNNGDLDGITGLTSTALATDTVALDATVWTLTAGQYPVLTSAKDEAQLKLDSRAVISLADNNFYSFIIKDATLGNTDELAWSLASGTAFSISGDTLLVTVPESGTVSDTLTAAAYGVTRQFPISSMGVYILSGEGTEASPFLINTADDMLTLSAFVESSQFDYDGFYFQVTADLDFTGKTYVPVACGTNMFRGIFDGNSKTISNLSLSGSTSDETGWGVFGTVGSGGAVKSLALDSTCVIAAYSYAGGIAANLYGSVENCSTAATVSSTSGSYVGGIAAFAYPGSSITGCSNTGTVYTATSYAGGILGATAAGAQVTIANCLNSGSVSSKTSYIGGIAGYASALISGSANTGSVLSSTKYAGGIIGYALATSSVADCHNEGEVGSNQYTGGIVGYSAAHTAGTSFVVENCYNTGTVLPAVTSSGSASSYTGGIGGYLGAGFEARDCYNTADIAASLASSGYIGGIMGYGNSTSSGPSLITGCYNTGNLTPDRNAGGIAGRFVGDENATIEYCYNTGDITATNTSYSYIGGIVGYGGYYITDCYNTGDITGAAKDVGGLSGYMSGKAYKYERCFNIGTVTAPTTSVGTYVGGLIGWGRPAMYDCANYGDVTGYNNVGGLLGYPGNASAESYIVSLNRSYNVGSISASYASASYGNITSYNSNCKYLEIDSCYFDASVTPATDYDTELASSGVTALSHSAMIGIDLGSGFVNGVATYPLIAGYEENEAHSFAIATILIEESENLDSVATDFKVGTPYGAVWSSSSNLVIDGNNVTLNNSETVEAATLTLTVGTLSRTYSLTINHDITSGINAAGIDEGKEISRTRYFTTSGIELAGPAAGMGVIIEQTVYTDGSTSVRKYTPR